MPPESRSKSSSSRMRGNIVPLQVHGAGAATRIRWARVSTAQARIAAGYYDRLDIQDRLADALIEELDSD
jgi:hypothetical protein